MLAADRTVAREVYHEGRNDFAWVYEVKFPIRDQDGRTRAIGGCALIATERNRSEQALHLSQERLARAQRIAKFGHWVWSGMAYAGWTSGTVGTGGRRRHLRRLRVRPRRRPMPTTSGASSIPTITGGSPPPMPTS